MRRYRNWLEAYVLHTRYSESPDSFHFWTGVATIAGALRRRVWIDQRIFQWTPNFYIILVGPPGVAAKSTSIRQGISLLERVPGIRFGPQSMTWQALATALERACEGVEINGEILPMSCLTIAISELGTFLRADNDELISTLIAMWDGQREVWRRETRTQGDTRIENPWLNIIGCTTPSWIRSNIPQNMIGGGLTSRIVFVYGEKKRQLVPYPSELVTHESYGDEEANLVHDLEQISLLGGEYKLSSEALRFGNNWYERLNTYRPPHMVGDRYDGYIARKQGHLHKLAMVFAASKRDNLIIEAEDLAEADTCLTDIEYDMQKVFASIGVPLQAQISYEVTQLIKNSQEINFQRLWQLCQSHMRLQDFQEAIKGLARAGYIQVTNRASVEYVKWTGPVDITKDERIKSPTELPDTVETPSGKVQSGS